MSPTPARTRWTTWRSCAYDDAVGRIASALLDSEADHLDLLADLKIVAPQAFPDIAAACEVCPIHVCDDQICADDDDPECRHLRETE